ncbi:hypothetical protein ZWY2020_058153 [Hordeum vulgare]|nr:hypothetical protein ZWY2020_058153 [Hordeum vulgare]
MMYMHDIEGLGFFHIEVQDIPPTSPSLQVFFNAHGFDPKVTSELPNHVGHPHVSNGGYHSIDFGGNDDFRCRHMRSRHSNDEYDGSKDNRPLPPPPTLRCPLRLRTGNLEPVHRDVADAPGCPPDPSTPMVVGILVHMVAVGSGEHSAGGSDISSVDVLVILASSPRSPTSAPMLSSLFDLDIAFEARVTAPVDDLELPLLGLATSLPAEIVVNPAVG